MFCDNKATIDNAYNHKMANQSKHIDVAYHLVHDNVECGRLSLLEGESVENWGDICPKGLPQITLWTLRTAIMDAK
jgi:hypothetical protein